MDKLNPLLLEVNRGLDDVRRRLDVRTGKALGNIGLELLKVYEAGEENGFDIFVQEV